MFFMRHSMCLYDTTRLEIANTNNGNGLEDDVLWSKHSLNRVDFCATYRTLLETFRMIFAKAKVHAWHHDVSAGFVRAHDAVPI